MSRTRIPWWRTDLGDPEIKAVTCAIRERHIHHGPVCRELETRLAEMLQVSHVSVTTSGSVSLLLALLACDVGPGDEVVIPAATFVAPAHAALLLGARVKLVDVCADRPLLDPNRLETVLTKRTKAIVAAHLNGRACNTEAIRAVATPAGVHVIEDAAQAFCSKGPGGWLGTAADAGTFSMGITKLMTTGEGGFIVTNDAAMNDRLTKLRNHGVIAIADNVFDGLGGNFRLTDLQAAIGLAQLERLQAKVEAVRRVYRFYAEAIADLPYIELLDVRVEEGELPLWVEASCVERDRVISLLAERGIESKAFHPSLAASPHLNAGGRYPNAERFARLGLTLPSGPDQPEDDLQTVVTALHEISGQITKRI